ncbi:MlaC/ttg2D family ABC transporter substrate-binding protein [Lichenicoccus sp.]|uniref:MlaC/ttg2D family ABC transporter substrate-binding protein n=1 Tax=Lichenicoccus sp. TaxID=2781899 RepID=UPI003D0FA13B
MRRARLLAAVLLVGLQPGAVLAATDRPALAGQPDPAPNFRIETQDPVALFIRDVGRQFPQVLDGATTLADKRRRLTPFIARMVDVEAVARFALGRHWAAATPAQRQRYVALFLKSLVNNIANRMASYQGGLGRIAILPPVVHPDGTTWVPTLVKGAGTPEARVSWVVETTPQAGPAGPMRIVDVVAEGMSLRLAKRSDFDAYLSRHGNDIAAFLDALQRQTDR